MTAYCIKAYSQNGVVGLERIYISTRFTNWKETTSRFASHEGSRCHKDALLVMVTLSATTCDIAESLSKYHSKEKLENQRCFLKLLSNVRFLGRQGLPFRGSGDGSDSNFLQLLKFRGEDNTRIFEWISDKYTLPQAQNEIVKPFAFQVLCEITANIRKALFFAVMVDEALMFQIVNKLCCAFFEILRFMKTSLVFIKLIGLMLVPWFL